MLKNGSPIERTMSSYLEMKTPTQAEINRGVIDRYGPVLRQNKRYGPEVARLLNSSLTNKFKKEGIVEIMGKRQKDPNAFKGGKRRSRSTRKSRSHRRTHRRRTSRS